MTSRDDRIEAYVLEGSAEYLAGRIVDLEDMLAGDHDLLSKHLERICRERPAWWVAFLERENRIRYGGRRVLS